MRTSAAATCPAVLIATCVLATISACDGQRPVPAPPVVTVAHPIAEDVTDWDQYTGRIEPVEKVEVRARVSGYLQSTHFAEGGMVAEGDLLFVIDPRPYRAVLQAAEAERTRARVRLELAGNDRARAERLFRSHAISEEELDARTQEQRGAVAALEGADAAVNAAKLNVDFTEVKAPIGGRIGRLHVTRGNLISGGTEGSTLLTTIVSVDPVYVYFTGDEREYLKYSRLNLEGSRPSSRDFANPVRIRLADEKEFVRQGRMDFVANVLDEASGTIQGRALFANGDGLLTPGLFVTVQLLGRGPYAALLIPDEAIGADQSRAFVYVVGEGDVAERRMIEVGRTEGNLRIVESGLTAMDRVVINGLPRVRAGAHVDPKLVEIPRLGATRPGSSAADAAVPAAVAR
ncbi:MAG TPA: efflux RND transporter periplasmic adaptor subunit [Gammaproteobacteria bacterium]|nr:efflux RND transporter periplasmic adaptor subunit [Gammaproteobacteria bacterium]